MFLLLYASGILGLAGGGDEALFTWCYSTVLGSEGGMSTCLGQAQTTSTMEGKVQGELLSHHTPTEGMTIFLYLKAMPGRGPENIVKDLEEINTLKVEFWIKLLARVWEQS